MASTEAFQQQMLQLQARMQQMARVAHQAEVRAQQSEARAQQAEARVLQVDTQLAAADAARAVDPPKPDIVDTRLLSKPKNFNGWKNEWVSWAFKMRPTLARWTELSSTSWTGSQP